MRLLVSSLVLLLLCSWAGAQASPPDEYERRAQKIEEELKLDGNPFWAGKYLTFTFLPHGREYITLAPKSGFVWHYISRSDYGPDPSADIDRYDYGDIEFRDDQIVLRPVTGNIKKTVFVPITWNKSRLLVTADRMVRFANMVNANCYKYAEEDPAPRLLLISGDWNFRTGKPNVPSTYRSWFLKAPVAAQISSVDGGGGSIEPSGGSHQVIYKVRLTGGNAQGIWKEMRLFLASRPRKNIDRANVRITNVSENSSEGDLTIDFTGERVPKPSTGWRLVSTSSNKGFLSENVWDYCRY